jgi:hypothetical protein
LAHDVPPIGAGILQSLNALRYCQSWRGSARKTTSLAATDDPGAAQQESVMKTEPVLVTDEVRREGPPEKFRDPAPASAS